jgi:two-component system cell cycle response regulator DivK
VTAVGEGRVVLVVEDNEKNMKLVRDVLGFHGFRVVEADTGEECLATASTLDPDVILMDIELPGMDGATALAQLRADPGTADIPVVALTASAMQADRERLLAAGFDAYMVKPIDVRTFPAEVRSYCRQPRGH